MKYLLIIVCMYVYSCVSILELNVLDKTWLFFFNVCITESNTDFDKPWGHFITNWSSSRKLKNRVELNKIPKFRKNFLKYEHNFLICRWRFEIQNEVVYWWFQALTFQVLAVLLCHPVFCLEGISLVTLYPSLQTFQF